MVSLSYWTDGKGDERILMISPGLAPHSACNSIIARTGMPGEADYGLANEWLTRSTEQFHEELAGLVTGTIQRWDAAETSTQLELLLGRDLQFIRINGTVVGAAVARRLLLASIVYLPIVLLVLVLDRV